MKTKLFRHSFIDNTQPHGDTLIEVTIATIIIGMILFSAFTLGSRAFALGQQAKERSQAAQLMQSQAEGLEAIRDHTIFAEFYSEIALVNQGSGFHVEVDQASNQWKLVSGPYTPTDYPIYTITITGGLASAVAEFDAVIAATWQTYGGGPDSTSTLYFNLADHNLGFWYEASANTTKTRQQITR